MFRGVPFLVFEQVEVVKSSRAVFELVVIEVP